MNILLTYNKCYLHWKTSKPYILLGPYGLVTSAWNVLKCALCVSSGLKGCVDIANYTNDLN